MPNKHIFLSYGAGLYFLYKNCQKLPFWWCVNGVLKRLNFDTQRIRESNIKYNFTIVTSPAGHVRVCLIYLYLIEAFTLGVLL